MFTTFTQSVFFFPIVFVMSIMLAMFFLVWIFRKNDNYQERCRAVCRMRTNKIRRQYGQPALK